MPTSSEALVDAMFREAYDELRRMAHGLLNHRSGARTLRPTALVHEAYLRLSHTYRAESLNRRHFFGAAAEAMRRILVEDSRRRLRVKRGGRLTRVPLEEVKVATDASPELLLSIDEALERFSSEFPTQAEVVRLVFFAGLTQTEVGECLEICDRTVKRHWAFARSWLYAELRREP